VDVADPREVSAALTAAKPAGVINCAAYHRVDECEDRAETAFRVNAAGALNVARVCEELGALCVYISSDYVFDGGKGAPFDEADATAPLNVYGASKVAGETLVGQACTRWMVARGASLFGRAGASGKRGNFVETILGKAKAGDTLRVVDDVRMSPTYTHDAARALERLVTEGATGLFHVTNAGAATWFGFARKILELAGVDASLEPSSASLQRPKARRPRDSSLTSRRLPPETAALLRDWDDALKAYLVEKGHI
jgi:dTDP-4-dehydrorhamnose reductase